jgi:hypothetical protein
MLRSSPLTSTYVHVLTGRTALSEVGGGEVSERAATSFVTAKDAAVGRSAPSYERGLVYLDAGRVGPLRVSAERVAATVQGSEDYLVELRAEGGKLRFSCSCPVGRQGASCKHCVAVAVAWLREHNDPAPTLDDARAHLETLPQSELVELLIDHAHDDEALARKLLLRAARLLRRGENAVTALELLTVRTLRAIIGVTLCLEKLQNATDTSSRRARVYMLIKLQKATF